MPKFQHGDQVRIIAGGHIGWTGRVFGIPTKALAPVFEGRAMGADSYLHRIDLDGVNGTLCIMESDLAPI